MRSSEAHYINLTYESLSELNGNFECSGVEIVSIFCKRLNKRDASRIDSVSWQGTIAQWLFCVFIDVTPIQQFCSANDVAKSFGSISSQMGPPIAHASLLGFWIPPLFWEDVNRWRQINFDFLLFFTKT